MRITIKQFAIVLLMGGLASSCRTAKVTTVSTAKTQNAEQGKIIQAPLVAELEVTTTKRTNETIQKPNKRSSLEEVKQTAIANALLKADGDVLLEPRFSIERNKKGDILSLSVSGYSARYKNFRLYEERDSIYLDAINGRYRVVNAALPFVSAGMTQPKIPAGQKEKPAKTSRQKETVQHDSDPNRFRPRWVNTIGLNVLSGIGGTYGLGYQPSRHFTYGMYLGYHYAGSADSYSSSNLMVGANVKWNILRTRLTPILSANAGLGLMEFSSPYFNYGFEVGAEYSWGRKSALALTFNCQNLGYLKRAPYAYKTTEYVSYYPYYREVTQTGYLEKETFGLLPMISLKFRF